MTSFDPRAFLCLGVCLLASPSFGLANATFTKSLSSVDAACDQPVYSFSGTADATTNDDGAGNDWYAFVYHDATGNYHDVDFGAVNGPAQSIGGSDSYIASLPFASFTGSRPLVARVHDIINPGSLDENSKQGLEFATAAPVAAELRFDPALDAGACNAKRLNDPALRIESLKNGSGQTVTSSTVLDLDGIGTTTISIAVPEPSMLIALFRAECSNDAADNASWADVDIRVDGVGLPPSGGNSFDAFCTSNGVAGHDEWVMARTSGAQIVAGPAVHTVAVLGASAGGTSALFDSELVVMVPEPLGRHLRAAGLAALALLAWRRRHIPPARSARGWRGCFCAALSLVALAASVAPARAGTVLVSTSNAANQNFVASSGPVLLNLGSGTSFALNLTRNTRVAILFTAECAVDASGVFTWLDLDIRVDGAAVPLSNEADDAFCTSNGATPGSQDRWVTTAYHVTIDLLAGAHSIQVQGQIQFGAATDEWWIGDLNLTVIGQEH